MDKLIQDYDVELIEPGCSPGAARWGAMVNLPNDISTVFPYLNAVINDAQYDPQNQVIVWGDEVQKYALRPHEIRIAQVLDPAQAERIVGEVVDKINQVWQERENITPRLAERKLPAVIDILRLLPMTNCRQCGYPTCMAFAADLRKAKTQLEQCLPLLQPENREKKEKLSELVSTD
jgi:ArsR family metal-binding transcriptional regulator